MQIMFPKLVIPVLSILIMAQDVTSSSCNDSHKLSNSVKETVARNMLLISISFWRSGSSCVTSEDVVFHKSDGFDETEGGFCRKHKC